MHAFVCTNQTCPFTPRMPYSAKAGTKLSYWARGNPHSATKTKAKGKRPRSKKAIKSSIPRKVAKLTRDVKRLSHDIDNLDGNFSYRELSYGDLVSLAADSNQFQHTHNSVAVLEGVLALLPYYDQSAPSDLATVSFLTGNYQKTVQIESSYSELTIRANYRIPVHYDGYVFRAKTDTDLAINALMTSQIQDFTNVTQWDHPLIHPQDFDLMKQLYTFKKVSSGLLLAGAQTTISMRSGRFDYSPASVDTHSDAYQTRYKAGSLVFRIWGPVGHDSVETDEQGRVQTTIDFIKKTVINVKYAAGANIKRIQIVDNSATFSNTGNMCNMPTANIQVESL